MALKLVGATQATTTSVQNGLSIEIAGVGDVHVGQASGSVGVHMAGSTATSIDGGHAVGARQRTSPAGRHRPGVAETLNAHIAGSGDIRAAKVTGQVNRFVAGSGTIIVGQ